MLTIDLVQVVPWQRQEYRIDSSVTRIHIVANLHQAAGVRVTGQTFRKFLHEAHLHARRPTERNILFNDALNTFYLRLYGVRHMVMDHSDSEKGNPLPPHRLLLLTARVLLYAPSHRQYNIPQPLLHQTWSTGWNEK